MIGAAWRRLDGTLTAWFDGASLTDGAVLARRILELTPDGAIDVRATGVRVRLASDEHAGGVARAAGELGLTASPTALQHVSVVVESPEPAGVSPFWHDVLGYVSGTGGALVDPLLRDPPVRVVKSTASRPLRNRIHLDVVRPGAAVDQLPLGEPFGPYGVCHRDADGNEVDVVPGAPFGDDAATNDWHAVFSAIACYRTSSPSQQHELAGAAAAVADAVGFPLQIDVRPGLVIVDSGKDLWERDAHGLDLDFADIAAAVQSAARDLGAVADPALPRFTQLAFDAVDIPTVRAFWMAALGYVPDRREGLTDIVDPRRLNTVLMFQDLDAADTARREQRNRIEVELEVPADVAASRVAEIEAAGGEVIERSRGVWYLADPEHNHLRLTASDRF